MSKEREGHKKHKNKAYNPFMMECFGWKMGLIGVLIGLCSG